MLREKYQLGEHQKNMKKNENELDQNVDFKIISPDVKKTSSEEKQENEESKSSTITAPSTRVKNSIEIKDLNTIIPENKEPSPDKFISTSSAIPQRVKQVIEVKDPTVITSQENTNERNRE